MQGDLLEKLSRRRKIYSGNAVGFSADVVSLPDGKKAVREYMEHPGAVAVIPFVDKQNILLVEQYRFPVKQVTFEIPAGKLEKGERPLSCVARELEEETGYRAKLIKKICSFWPTPAFSDEVIHVYRADKLVRRQCLRPDDDEFIRAHKFPFKKVLDWIKAGRIRDSKTIIALLAYQCAL
jgi:ADP-ribose pyrophosphatase